MQKLFENFRSYINEANEQTGHEKLIPIIAALLGEFPAGWEGPKTRPEVIQMLTDRTGRTKEEILNQTKPVHEALTLLLKTRDIDTAVDKMSMQAKKAYVKALRNVHEYERSSKKHMYCDKGCTINLLHMIMTNGVKRAKELLGIEDTSPAVPRGVA